MTPDEIQDIIENNAVVVFGKGEKDMPRCGFTANMQHIFDEVYPEYIMVNILGDPEFAQLMCKISDWPTFPQIYIHGEFIGGGDIITEMYEDGELSEAIENSKKTEE